MTMENNIPKVLEDFFTKLTDEDANEIWSYLQQVPPFYAMNEVIEIIANSHPRI